MTKTTQIQASKGSRRKRDLDTREMVDLYHIVSPTYEDQTLCHKMAHSITDEIIEVDTSWGIRIIDDTIDGVWCVTCESKANRV